MILTSWKAVRTATFCIVPGLVRWPHSVGGPCEVGRKKKNAVIVASFENEDRVRMRLLRKVPGPLKRLSLIISKDPLLQMKKRGSRGEIQSDDYNPMYQILELIFSPLPMYHSLPRGEKARNVLREWPSVTILLLFHLVFQIREGRLIIHIAQFQSHD